MVEAMAREFHGEDDRVRPAVLEELERHADTAPLAGEIREKRPLGGASESDQLAELAQTPAAADRLKQALEASMSKASGKEAGSPVMGHLAAAETHLEARQSELAGGEFQELGGISGVGRKAEAREELQALAGQLREGAENLAGATEEGARETGPAEPPPPGAESLAAQAPPTPSENAATTPPPVQPGGPKSPPPFRHAAPMPGPPGGPVPGSSVRSRAGNHRAAPIRFPGFAGSRPRSATRWRAANLERTGPRTSGSGVSGFDRWFATRVKRRRRNRRPRARSIEDARQRAGRYRRRQDRHGRGVGDTRRPEQQCPDGIGYAGGPRRGR